MVQPIIKSRRTTTYQMFVGLLRCPDCGRTLTFKGMKDRKSYGYYACSTFRTFGKNYCSMYYIGYESIYEESIRKQQIDIYYKFVGKVTLE